MDEGVNCGSEKETNIETATKKDENTASYIPDYFCDHHSFFCNIARAVLSKKIPAQEILLAFSNEKGTSLAPAGSRTRILNLGGSCTILCATRARLRDYSIGEKGEQGNESVRTINPTPREHKP